MTSKEKSNSHAIQTAPKLSGSVRATFLVHSGYYNKNTIDWVAYRHNRTLTVLTSGKSKMKVLADSVIWWGTSSRFTASLDVSSYGGKGEGSVESKGTNPIIRAARSWHNHLLLTHHAAHISISTQNLGGNTVYSLYTHDKITKIIVFCELYWPLCDTVPVLNTPCSTPHLLPYFIAEIQKPYF